MTSHSLRRQKSLFGRLTKSFAGLREPSATRRNHRKLRIEPLEDRRLLAGVFNWTGATDTDWGTSDNWSLVGDDVGGIPDADDLVTIDNVVNDPLLDGNRDVGFLQGDGEITLGAHALTVGDLVGNPPTPMEFTGIMTGSGKLIKTGSGTLILTGANTYTGNTELNEGTLLVNGSITSSVNYGNLGNPMTLGGTGTVAGFITGVGSHVTLAPGDSTGTTTGTLETQVLTVFAGAQFDFEINPTGHDQVYVSGGGDVTIANAVLNLSGSGASTSDSIVLIRRDSGNDVIGTFDGLAEGAAVSVGDFTGTITYVGGVNGKEVVLVGSGPPADTLVARVGGDLVISDIKPGGKNDTLVVSQIGPLLEIHDPSAVLKTSIPGAIDAGANTVLVPLSSFSGGIIVNTLDGDDSLSVSFATDHSRTITYNGGDQNNSPNGDTLSLSGGGTFADATFNYTNANDGSIDITGNPTISYTGLEPITSTINATNVTLNYGGTSETITVTYAGGGQTTVNSTAGEMTTFNDPTSLLTINAGDGNDIVNVDSLAGPYGASLNLNGGTGNDTLNVNGELSLNKNFTGSADTINLTAGSQLFAGSVTLQADRNIVLSSASSISAVGARNVTQKFGL